MITLVKLNSEEVKSLLEGLDDLVEIKSFIRTIVPNYEMEEDSLDEFKSMLMKVYEKLKPLFEKYLDVDIESSIERSLDNIKKQMLEIQETGNVILISANSNKKKLKGIGVDPRSIIVTGGPLVAEDYKIVNPSIPDNALQGIEKKCKRIISDINSEDWAEKELFFIREIGNLADDLIIEKISKLSELIGKDVRIMNIESWDDLE